MDIERVKKLLKSGIEAGNKVKAVREVVKTYKTQKQDMYDDTAEILKPSIEVQKKVKKTIDEKQDEVIKQLKDNQVNLIQSVDALSDAMSEQGSVSGMHSWVDDLPSDFNPLDIIGEEDGEEDEEEPKSLFEGSDTEIIKNMVLTQHYKPFQKNDDIKDRMASTVGKMNSKNAINKKIAKKELTALKKYHSAVKAARLGAKKTGKGIRRYNQPKRNAYKISQNGQYGGLVIDLPILHGHLKVIAYKNGQKVYDKQADFDTLDLLTKRFNSKKNYSELTRSVFDDLNRLSEIPIHKTSKKYSKIGNGVVYYNNLQDLLSRLELLGGSMSAGDNSSDVREEFVKIVHKLNELNVLDNKQMNDLMKEYLI